MFSARVTSLDQRRYITAKMMGGQFLKAEIVRKTGKNLLSDPLFNKGLGFPRTERDRLGIRGLVPPSTLDQAEQGEVIMAEYREGWAARAEKEPDDEIIKSGVKPDNIRKWKVLQSLQDRNETLFYRWDDTSVATVTVVLQTADGQFLRDGPHHLHPHRGLGLLPLLPPVQTTPRHVLLQVRQGRDGQHGLQLGE